MLLRGWKYIMACTCLIKILNESPYIKKCIQIVETVDKPFIIMTVTIGNSVAINATMSGGRKKFYDSLKKIGVIKNMWIPGKPRLMKRQREYKPRKIKPLYCDWKEKSDFLVFSESYIFCRPTWFFVGFGARCILPITR